MKYIRTKWSIFEVVEETDLVYRVKAKWTPTHIYSKSKCQTEVIKQADTIEELCDEFVYVKRDINTIFCDLPKAEKKLYKSKKSYWEIIYGAIWTDKGLIYVAKMNEKGELELL